MKIKVAYLQAAIIVPGIRTTETTLSQIRVPGIEMELTIDGLLVTARNEKSLVPVTNIKSMVLDLEDEKPKKALKP